MKYFIPVMLLLFFAKENISCGELFKEKPLDDGRDFKLHGEIAEEAFKTYLNAYEYTRSHKAREAVKETFLEQLDTQFNYFLSLDETKAYKAARQLVEFEIAFRNTKGIFQKRQHDFRSKYLKPLLINSRWTWTRAGRQYRLSLQKDNTWTIKKRHDRLYKEEPLWKTEWLTVEKGTWQLFIGRLIVIKPKSTKQTDPKTYNFIISVDGRMLMRGNQPEWVLVD